MFISMDKYKLCRKQSGSINEIFTFLPIQQLVADTNVLLCNTCKFKMQFKQIT